MDELKLYGKTERELQSLVHTADNIKRYWHEIWNGQIQCKERENL